MARLTDAEIDRIKRETDLAAVVRSRGVALTEKGGDLIGLCPFHDDKTPSLHVTPAKGLWRCVSCLATGNVMVVYGAFAQQGIDCLAGYSVGGPSSVQPIDISVALAVPLTVHDFGSQGLVLDASSAPSLGNAGFAFVTSAVPSLVPLGVLFVGDAVVNPGLDLTFLGMPGCSAYTNGNLASATFPVVTRSSSAALNSSMLIRSCSSSMAHRQADSVVPGWAAQFVTKFSTTSSGYSSVTLSAPRVKSQLPKA